MSSSEYDGSDSDDYTENEKILLENVRNRGNKDSDSEDEVYGVGGDDSDQSDVALSDIEDERADLPDIKAWGKEKRKFYSTDYVDPDTGTYNAKNAELAEQEGEEAENLHGLQALDFESGDLGDNDFNNLIKKQVEAEAKKTSEKEPLALSELNEQEKKELLQEKCPVFFILHEDFAEKIDFCEKYLEPVMLQYTKGQIPSCPAMEFVLTYRDLILNYCANIQMFQLLQASEVDVFTHPIMDRIKQFRYSLSQMEPIFEEQIKPQLEIILQADVNEENVKPPKKMLKIVSELIKNTPSFSGKRISRDNTDDAEKKDVKKVKFDDELEVHDEDDYQENNEESEEAEKVEVGKRPITYQMAKNKGLTPHRKKEQRNPRVKHKNKFRKAKSHRRGAIREARTEMTRYGGEASGIKINVVKSIKIKS